MRVHRASRRSPYVPGVCEQRDVTRQPRPDDVPSPNENEKDTTGHQNDSNMTNSSNGIVTDRERSVVRAWEGARSCLLPT